MGPFNRKAAQVVEEVVATEAGGVSTAAMALVGFLVVWYGAKVLAFMYQESKVSQRPARASVPPPPPPLPLPPPRRHDSAVLGCRYSCQRNCHTRSDLVARRRCHCSYRRRHRRDHRRHKQP